ncbi:MAG TPA: macro domain-containing protein [Ktedonobacteraceae bacterium]
MAITYVSGNIFDAPVEVLVIPVNCVGVAGCGLALQCKQRYPVWYQLYRECCRSGALWIGHPVLHWGIEPMVLSFPTKDHWRDPSRLVDVEMGLLKANKLCIVHGIASIAYPKLGTGAGGLSWKAVRPLMEEYLRGLPLCDIRVYV